MHNIANISTHIAIFLKPYIQLIILGHLPGSAYVKNLSKFLTIVPLQSSLFIANAKWLIFCVEFRIDMIAVGLNFSKLHAHVPILITFARSYFWVW
ncbi:hypothetical protein ACJX0J_011064, partial [Zea mays]